MKFILGTKVGMTQVFDENGNVTPVTLVQAGPVQIVQKKTKEKDGYSALQVGFGSRKHVGKPLAGHLKGLSNFRYLKEFRMAEEGEYKKGDEIRADVFVPGDAVRVSGISKGKGFAGVVKRHGFGGLPHTHGQKHEERKGGSIGRAFPERVLPGTRMAGRMGADRVSVKNVKIIKVDAEHNIIAVSGAVPGKRGTLLEIRSIQ